MEYQDRLSRVSVVIGETGDIEGCGDGRRLKDLVLGLQAAQVADGLAIQVIPQAGLVVQALLELFLQQQSHPFRTTTRTTTRLESLITPCGSDGPASASHLLPNECATPSGKRGVRR